MVAILTDICSVVSGYLNFFLPCSKSTALTLSLVYRNILVDKPSDQSSRWSSESNYPPQVNLIALSVSSPHLSRLISSLHGPPYYVQMIEFNVLNMVSVEEHINVSTGKQNAEGSFRDVQLWQGSAVCTIMDGLHFGMVPNELNDALILAVLFTLAATRANKVILDYVCSRVQIYLSLAAKTWLFSFSLCLSINMSLCGSLHIDQFRLVVVEKK